MFRDRLFSFQEDSSQDFDISEFEEAILERDRIINGLIGQVDVLKKTIENKENIITKITRQNQKFQEKIGLCGESLKKILNCLKEYKQEQEKMKKDFEKQTNEIKSWLKSNENSLKKQTTFRKNFLKKLREMKNKRSTMESENMDTSEPYLNIIAKNFKSLNQKIDNISNNFQDSQTKNFLINFPENSNQIAFQSKPNNKQLVFSSEDSMNNVNDKKNNEMFKLFPSTRSTHYPLVQTPLELGEFQKIKAKYSGFEQKFKGLINNLKTRGKMVTEDKSDKNKIFNYLEQIEKKLGINAKIKEQSFHLLNSLNYKSF